MKTTVSNLSNRRLEAEIANVYFSAAKEAPGVSLRETGLLGMLWEEFDRRVAEGTMTDDDEAVLDTSGRWIG